MAVNAKWLEGQMRRAYNIVRNKIFFILGTNSMRKGADPDLRARLLALLEISKHPRPYLQSISKLVDFMTSERNIESFFRSRHRLRKIPVLNNLDAEFNKIISEIKRAFT
ncbi:MAG: hypothetical protein HYT16_01835 [DPANN group archaeon]|nr:hypothetical protein [DPANN group archaeon]